MERSLRCGCYGSQFIVDLKDTKPSVQIPEENHPFFPSLHVFSLQSSITTDLQFHSSFEKKKKEIRFIVEKELKFLKKKIFLHDLFNILIPYNFVEV